MNFATFKKRLLCLTAGFVCAGFLAGVIGLFLLPEQIPMQWSGLRVEREAPRLAIFVWPAVSLVVSLFFVPFLLSTYNSGQIGRTYWYSLFLGLLLLVLFTAVLYTILFCSGIIFRIDYLLVGETLLALGAGTIGALRKRQKG